MLDEAPGALRRQGEVAPDPRALLLPGPCPEEKRARILPAASNITFDYAPSEFAAA